jgi:hypothetical protein
MRGLEELDALRGLMLVWITLTHLPTALSTYVNQPFGFISAAEGFIFLSALFTGRIHSRLAQRNGYSTLQKQLRKRTLKLYLYHALSLLELRLRPLSLNVGALTMPKMSGAGNRSK